MSSDRPAPSVPGATAQHRVLLFAGLRQQARTDVLSVELGPDATVADLIVTLGREHPELAAGLSQCRVAVDQEFVDPTRRLCGGEEIALIPPVSGGHDPQSRGKPPAVHLTFEPLSLQAVVSAVEHDGAGGIATFTGNVREHSRGHRIEHLDYEAYEPMALGVMSSIVSGIQARIPGTRVAIHHRLGRLEVGDTAVVIAASAAHRAEAFDACRAAIEALKVDVPIWKREVSTDGAEWLGSGP